MTIGTDISNKWAKEYLRNYSNRELYKQIILELEKNLKILWIQLSGRCVQMSDPWVCLSSKFKCRVALRTNITQDSIIRLENGSLFQVDMISEDTRTISGFMLEILLNLTTKEPQDIFHHPVPSRELHFWIINGISKTKTTITFENLCHEYMPWVYMP